ncbi:MAG: erythromycin esterase family protein [Bacteroidota bacterium]
MKPNLLSGIAIAATILFNINTASAQQQVAKENAITIGKKEISAFSTTNYKAFKVAVAPLIKQMGAKKVVGLGEGTHGTAEFYKIRFWISRILIEDYGFTYIAFENDLSDVWLLNQQLSTTNNLNTLMKNHLMSIWQNEETKEMLAWVKKYNADHKKKVIISGIDYPLLKPDVDMLLAVLAKANNQAMLSAANGLLKAAALQDEAWIGMNDKAYKANMKAVLAGSKKGYVTTDSLEKQVQSSNFPTLLKAEAQLALANLKQGFAPFYGMVEEAERDSLMAHNAALILKGSNDKMIVWAHNAHLGKVKIYGGAVGGTGDYLLKLFPNNYFALGTGTANGTFAGTVDKRPTNSNPMITNTLEKPIKDSWEELFSATGVPNFYFSTSTTKFKQTIKPLRFIGFGTNSDASTYDKSNLNKLFDAFLFIKDTNAPTPLK